MSEPPPAPPRLLGRYALYDEIASGGMATVHLGRLLGPVGFSRTVAIKRMHPHLAGDPEFVSMFLDEARLAARLSHPNVVPTIDIVADGGELFIVMEYVRGASLLHLIRDAIARGVLIPAPIVASVLVGVLHGLHAAHEATSERGEPLEMVHRDVSPQNILVGVDGVARVLDFGVAKAVGRLQTTREGQLKGKLGYMAPEQLSGHVSRATDIYSASVVLWEALTASRLFAGDSDGEVLGRVMAGCDDPPSAHAPGLPPALDAVTLRGLAVDPAERYATAQAMASALEDAVPLVAASKVGDWVAAAAKASLERSSGRITAIESDSATTGSGGLAVGKGSSLRAAPAPAHPRGARSRLWAFVALAAIGAASIVALHRRQPVAASAASPAVAAPPRATTLADLPPPATTVPQAAAEYTAGIQALHDNSWDLAADHFEKTVALDPSLAIAHLRVAMVEDQDATLRREQFAKAAALRAQLGPRDQALMEALEPVLQRAHVDRAEARARLERMIEKYPLDVELLDWLAFLWEGDPSQALPPAERAIALDPQDGQAWETKGQSLGLLERPDEARAAFQRCADLAVDSVDCVRDLAGLDAHAGRCEDYEKDARRVADRDPRDAYTLAGAMLALGQSPDAAREVLAPVFALEAESKRTANAARFEIVLASRRGDFATAAKLARERTAGASSDPKRGDLRFQLGLTVALTEALDEAGRDDDARKAAFDFVVRSGAWATDTAVSTLWDPSFLVLRRALGRGGLSPEDFERRRVAWIDERIHASSVFPGMVWTAAYAAAAWTTEEAIAALAALPRFAPITSYAYGGHPDADAYIGRLYLLAGKPEEAVPYLRRAVADCAALFSYGVQTRAALHLGQALESMGDKAGACVAYGIVKSRWGHAKPRSVTADLAKARAKTLACPPG